MHFTMADLESLKKRRSVLYRQFTREYNVAKALTEQGVTDVTIVELKARLRGMKKAIADYSPLNTNIMDILVEKDASETDLDEAGIRQSEDGIKVDTINEHIEKYNRTLSNVTHLPVNPSDLKLEWLNYQNCVFQYLMDHSPNGLHFGKQLKLTLWLEITRT